MLKKIIKNNLGVTLLEMIVSVALFSVVVISATQIFKMVVEGQRNAIAAQNIQESIRYAFETMVKEVRMAQKDESGTCTGGANKIYGVSADNSELYFINYHGDCTEYYLEADANGIFRLKIDRGLASAYITSNDIQISNLEFFVVDNLSSLQSMVTIKMDIEAIGKEMHKQKMTIQTTVSARYYE